MASPPAPKLSRPVQILLVVALCVNLLDLTTSRIESPADHLWPIPDKPLWMLLLQCALLLPLAAIVWGARARIASALRGLPVPRPAAIALGLFLAIAISHVALRAERYPFSPITMFSSGVPEPTDPMMHTEGYAVLHPEGVEVISWLREGNPLFARHGFGFDYKAGWAMHMYAYSHSTARDLVVEQLAAEGAPAPVRVGLEYRRADGRLRLPEGQRELP